jgi:hypothetical protein
MMALESTNKSFSRIEAGRHRDNYLFKDLPLTPHAMCASWSTSMIQPSSSKAVSRSTCDGLPVRPRVWFPSHVQVAFKRDGTVFVGFIYCATLSICIQLSSSDPRSPSEPCRMRLSPAKHSCMHMLSSMIASQQSFVLTSDQDPRRIRLPECPRKAMHPGHRE